MDSWIGWNQTLTLYAKAEAIFHRLHNSVSLAMIHCNQGIAYRQLQRSAEAIQAFQAGIVLWDQVSNLRADQPGQRSGQGPNGPCPV